MLIKAIENGSNNNLAAKCPKPHLLKANVAAIPLLKSEKKKKNINTNYFRKSIHL